MISKKFSTDGSIGTRTSYMEATTDTVEVKKKKPGKKGEKIPMKAGRPVAPPAEPGTGRRPTPPEFEETEVKGITSAWLIWVGSEFYKGIADWSDEAIALGISKRLPNASMARQLAAPGTVVFVAHDEGESHSCTKCVGACECPSCRKRISEMTALRNVIASMKAAFKGDFVTEAPRGLKRFEEVRLRTIAELEAEMKACEECKGKGSIKAGTGGEVALKDGRVWDYRTYNYWLHQPKKFDPETMVAEVEMCETCGGKGDLPNAQIFGVFAPERVEYIARGDETKEELEALKGFRIVEKDVLKTEAKRKCGVRKAGGVYAVTSAEGADGDKLLQDAIKAGLVKPDGAEVHGSFIRFGRPVPVAEKRFRGLKKINLGTVREAVDQAEMIAEASEA